MYGSKYQEKQLKSGASYLFLMSEIWRRDGLGDYYFSLTDILALCDYF